MKKRAMVFVVIAVLIPLIACCILYLSGTFGIAEDAINREQMKTVSWDTQDYDTIGVSDGESLYAGVMYLKDYSEAKYFIYIKKAGLSLGWHFLRSGSLSETDGIRAFDCGKYGIAYVSMNTNGTVRRIEFEDGRQPSKTEKVGKIICERSQDAIHFYDAKGNRMEYNMLTVLE